MGTITPRSGRGRELFTSNCSVYPTSYSREGGISTSFEKAKGTQLFPSREWIFNFNSKDWRNLATKISSFRRLRFGSHLKCRVLHPSPAKSVLSCHSSYYGSVFPLGNGRVSLTLEESNHRICALCHSSSYQKTQTMRCPEFTLMSLELLHWG